MNKTKCIRVFADINQINGCIKLLKKTDGSITRLAKVLNLAGNEVRLKILYLIYKEGQMCVCDLSDVLNMNVPAISQHLRKLKDGNILLDKKVGQIINYLINEDYLEILLPLFIQISKQNKGGTIMKTQNSSNKSLNRL